MTNELLEEYPPVSRLAYYLNAKVTVYTGQSTYSDTGRLTYMDTTWVEVTKDNGERLLIPIVAIRIIKLLESPKLDGDAGTLLRASDGQNEPKRIGKE